MEAQAAGEDVGELEKKGLRLSAGTTGSRTASNAGSKRATPRSASRKQSPRVSSARVQAPGLSKSRFSQVTFAALRFLRRNKTKVVLVVANAFVLIVVCYTLYNLQLAAQRINRQSMCASDVNCTQSALSTDAALQTAEGNAELGNFMPQPSLTQAQSAPLRGAAADDELAAQPVAPPAAPPLAHPVASPLAPPLAPPPAQPAALAPAPPAVPLSAPHTAHQAEAPSQLSTDEASSSTYARPNSAHALLPRLEIWSGGGLQYPLCRISHVHLSASPSSDSVETNYIALLPSSLREILRRQKSAKICGLKHKHFGFYNDDADLRQQSEQGRDYIWPIYQPMEFHFPHFLSRFIERDYALASLLVGDWSVMADFNYSCIDAAGQKCAHPTMMAPGYFLHQRVFEKSPWIREFLHSMEPQMHFVGTAAIAENTSLACRSIVTGIPQLPAGPSLTHHTVYSRNGIDVTSKKEDCSRSHKTILILDRMSDHEKRVGYGRSFLRREELLAQLEKEAASKRLNVSVVWRRFENATFEDQVAVMNEADVVFAAHGAGITNLIFMRKSALLFEVFPFAHVVSIFKDMADRLHVPYKFTIAKPQPEAVLRCLKLANMPLTQSAMQTQRTKAELDRVMQLFRTAGKEYAASKSEEYTMSDMSVKVQRWNLFKQESSLKWLMACLRHQELQVNEKVMARDIVQHIRAQCLRQ